MWTHCYVSRYHIICDAKGYIGAENFDKESLISLPAIRLQFKYNQNWVLLKCI
jgi:hypothetical protein